LKAGDFRSFRQKASSSCAFSATGSLIVLQRRNPHQLRNKIVHRRERGFTLPFEHWPRDAVHPIVENSVKKIGDNALAGLSDPGKRAMRVVCDLDDQKGS
jgi:hypothetical protein